MKIDEDEKKIQWKQEELDQIDSITYVGTLISNKKP